MCRDWGRVLLRGWWWWCLRVEGWFGGSCKFLRWSGVSGASGTVLESPRPAWRAGSLGLEDSHGMLKAKVQGISSMSSVNALAMIVVERIVGKVVRKASAHDLRPLCVPQ